ncbi:signal peptidase I [candidate division CPR3 bacterium GWF2_35_18]|nr:MAG: signal peptidase I [candidate division CPR3 bacterium GWF2_35_18]OGB64891.1 MAG: signal peptidase I [candidate division CPR3 bacterium RIFOXYA2_FULL_35_13]OGB76918.1 MAG: signal peptidase I [candidate division CPR3 bacterium RIFOXYC2_FULL_35_7]OGB78342.1 MAG: signal peptidase I [candidate division CPR3 bacterium RIFOXYB2_FULL_35_8]OGB80225.1 MAG: signal peptidase I [candidate division CPR3 bacterium GWE2_35_7]
MLGEFFLDLAETFIIAIGLFIIIYNFLVQPNSVIGSSMEPNFEDGEYILTDRLSYRLREPKRGEVVVFKYPKDETLDYIKRIIALPGERVLIENNTVTIFNGQNPKGFKLDESYLADYIDTQGGIIFPEGKETVVPNDAYFVMGDNRPRSSDSRSWGTVPKTDLIGRVIFRYWPFDKLGLVK